MVTLQLYQTKACLLIGTDLPVKIGDWVGEFQSKELGIYLGVHGLQRGVGLLAYPESLRDRIEVVHVVGTAFGEEASVSRFEFQLKWRNLSNYAKYVRDFPALLPWWAHIGRQGRSNSLDCVITEIRGRYARIDFCEPKKIGRSRVCPYYAGIIDLLNPEELPFSPAVSRFEVAQANSL